MNEKGESTLKICKQKFKYMEIEKRTKIDFSKHEFTKIEEQFCSIFKLAKPDTVIDSFTFINSCGVLTVTGDYGNWVFCREFHPSADGYVSDYYWCEKLKIYSEQESHEFDSEATANEIKRILKEPEENLTEEEVDFLNYLLLVSDDKIEYEYTAFRDYHEKGRFDNYESIPYVKKIHPRLEYVFDAFEEMCNRMKPRTVTTIRPTGSSSTIFNNIEKTI